MSKKTSNIVTAIFSNIPKEDAEVALTNMFYRWDGQSEFDLQDLTDAIHDRIKATALNRLKDKKILFSRHDLDSTSISITGVDYDSNECVLLRICFDNEVTTVRASRGKESGKYFHDEELHVMAGIMDKFHGAMTATL